LTNQNTSKNTYQSFIFSSHGHHGDRRKRMRAFFSLLFYFNIIMKNMHKMAIAGAMLSAVATVAFAATTYTGVSLDATHYGASGAVTVSATVAPVLSMTLSGETIGFPTLAMSTTNNATSSTDITVRTNAFGGYSVVASAPALEDSVSHNLITLGVIGNGSVSATKSTPATGVVMSRAASSITPDAGDVQNITYTATTDAIETAGIYNSTVTYTTTATF
jgi:hypothetical protein